jgi:hypothetical protein
MMDAIERVARAIAEDIETSLPPRTKMAWEELTLPARATMLRRARIAIEAMREPSEEMITVGVDDALKGPGIGAYLNWRDYVASRFRLMIDAALNPQTAK